MRVKIDNFVNPPSYGEFLGLVIIDDTDTCAVVRIEGFGLYLQTVHPSRVSVVTSEQEREGK